MPKYAVDPNPYRPFSSTTIGILKLKTRYTFIPGMVGTASTFQYPVVYEVVYELEGNVLVETANPSLAGPIIKKAQARAQRGFGDYV